MPICCSSGRSVARDAQIQPSETSMKLQILSGTIVSTEALSAYAEDLWNLGRCLLTSQIFGD